MDKKIIYCKEETLGRISGAMNELYNALRREAITVICKDCLVHKLETPHVIIKFVTDTHLMDGVRCDEYFGFDPSDNMHYRLKDPCKTRYRGTVIGYIVKTEAEETLKDDQEAFKRQQRMLINTTYGSCRGGLHLPYLYKIDKEDEFAQYCVNDVMNTAKLFNIRNEILDRIYLPNIKSYIKKVVFNDPATIIIWTDDTKTVVKAENEPFDPEKGMAMAIAKKVLGNKHDYYNTFVKWMKKYKPEESSNGPRTDAKRKALEEAYQILLKADDTRYDGKEGKATKIDYYMTVETALGYLGEALEG